MEPGRADDAADEGYPWHVSNVSSTSRRGDRARAARVPRHAPSAPYAGGMPTATRNITTALDQVTEPWQPHLLARFNDHELKVAKLHGEFIWHAHPDTDEMFVVVSGSLTLQLRDGDVQLGPHDVYVVPRGVEHCPRADDEVSVLLVELAGTRNTGDVGGERTTETRELPA